MAGVGGGIVPSSLCELGFGEFFELAGVWWVLVSIREPLQSRHPMPRKYVCTSIEGRNLACLGLQKVVSLVECPLRGLPVLAVVVVGVHNNRYLVSIQLTLFRI